MKSESRLEQIRKALHDSLHERIPVDDYMNEMYSARPIADFEIDGEHEIPGVYSSTGKPIVLELAATHTPGPWTVEKEKAVYVPLGGPIQIQVPPVTRGE